MRKYNPYNPYVEENKEQKKENLKIESLDDLFEEETVGAISDQQPKEETYAPTLPQE